MNRPLLHLLTTALALFATLAASAQSFRIHRGMEVTETRDAIALGDHADADYIEVRGATFDLAVSNVTQTSCTLHVTPSNHGVRYYYDVCTRATLDADFGGSVATLIEGYIGRLLAQYGSTFSLETILDETLAQGEDEDDLRGLPAGTEMAFYAMAVDDEGHCCGEPALTFFTTDPAGDPKDCTFAVDVSHIHSDRCLVTIEPSDASVNYWYGICAVSEWPGDYAMTAEVSESIYEYAKDYNISVSSVASRVVYSGPISMEESGLAKQTPYYAYCYAMDTETGDALGPVTKVRFETLDYDRSAAEVALDVRYFAVDDLATIYPERFSAASAGRCYMQVVVTPNAACSNWAIALAKGDLSDEMAYPEETTKNAVLQGGKLSHEINNFVCDWSSATLFAFGVDAAGIDGPLQRIVITPTLYGVSPAADFIPDTPTPAAAPLSIIPQTTKQIINNSFNHHEEVSFYPSYRSCQRLQRMGRRR